MHSRLVLRVADERRTSATQRWTVGSATITSVVEVQDDIPPGVPPPRRHRGDGAAAPVARSRLGRRRRQHRARGCRRSSSRSTGAPCSSTRASATARRAGSRCGTRSTSRSSSGSPTPAASPADVELVVHTHLHADHVGWDTHRDGDDVGADVHQRAAPLHRGRARARAHVRAPRRGRVRRLDRVRSSTRASPTSSNPTPTSATDCGSSRRRATRPVTRRCGSSPTASIALITGDFMHHPLQFAEPHLAEIADADVEVARQTRRRMLREHGAHRRARARRALPDAPRRPRRRRRRRLALRRRGRTRRDRSLQTSAA